MSIIRPGCQNKNSVSKSEPTSHPSEVSDRGSGSSVSENPPQQNRFSEMEPDSSSASSVQSTFGGAVDGIADGVNDWSNVNEITKSYNTYPCIRIPITNLNI